MTSGRIRSSFKRALPRPVRMALRALLHYAQRILRWPIILWQVRGQTPRDTLALMASAIVAPMVSVRNLLGWQDPVLVWDANVVVPGYGKFGLRARTDDLWHVVPWREQAISNTLAQSLKPGDVFIDAGANIGIYSLLAARLVGPAGRVLSIEMMPDTADRLENHIRMNGLQNVTVIRHALSDSQGQIVRATVQVGKYGQATIADESGRYGLGSAIEVETTTLDALTSEIGEVRLMKIDVEGAELKALRGASRLLQRLHAVVYESLGWKRVDTDPVDDLLKGAGFSIRQIDGNNWVAERYERA